MRAPLLPSRFHVRSASVSLSQRGRRFTERVFVPGDSACGPVRVEARVIDGDEGRRLRVRLVPDGAVLLHEVRIELSADMGAAARVMLNGYQSWTETRERSAHERFLAMPAPLRWLLGPFGDAAFAGYSWRRGVSHGFTYGYVRDGEHIALIGAVSEDGGFLAIEVDVARGQLVLRVDVAGCTIDEPLDVLDVFMVDGPEGAAFDAWFAARGHGCARRAPLAGWTSWYLHFTQVTEAQVLGIVRSAKDLDVPLQVMQIDDGYQTAVGDHLDVDPKKFPRGLGPVAADIKAAGYEPGLWLAPFVCTKASALYARRPSLLERNAKGTPLRAGYNPWWHGDFYALDADLPEARALVEQTLEGAMAMGFSFLKLDFLYAAALTHRHNRPRGRRMRDVMQWIRGLTKGKTLLGCGVPLGAALGLVDYCRVGSDVSPRWEKPLLRSLQYRERPSTRNSLSSTLGRRHLDGRGFINDADVFFLRSGHVEMTADERRTLFVLNAVFSGLLFTSDDIASYDQDATRSLLSLFPLMQRTIASVDHKDPAVDAVVEVGGRRYRVLANLGEGTARFSLPRVPCFEMARGVFMGGELSLGSHQALLVHIIEGGDVVLAGSPYVFPAADCTLVEAADGWSVVRHPASRARGEITLLHSDSAAPLRINGVERHSVGRVGDMNVVRC